MVVEPRLHLLHHLAVGKGLEALHVFGVGLTEHRAAGGQLVVLGIRYRLQPLIGGALLHLRHIRQVLHPRVLGGTMPVLGLGGDGHHYAGAQHHGLLALLDIPAAARHADEHLHRLVVDVPVVAAARLEGDVHQPVLAAERCQIAVADEILGVGRVQFALRPYVKIYIFFHFLLCVDMRHCQEQGDDGCNNSHCLI